MNFPPSPSVASPAKIIRPACKNNMFTFSKTYVVAKIFCQFFYIKKIFYVNFFKNFCLLEFQVSALTFIVCFFVQMFNVAYFFKSKKIQNFVVIAYFLTSAAENSANWQHCPTR
jgi:hypothetical protein